MTDAVERYTRVRVSFPVRVAGYVAASIAIAVVLYYLSTKSYLLFHSVAEIFSIVIGCAVFMIAWNSRRFRTDNRFGFLGVAYLFVAILDLFHTLSYAGMNIFTDYSFYANQVWIAARAMEALSLLLFAAFGRRDVRINLYVAFAIYAIASALLLASIFELRIFPICYVANAGQTTFKIGAELVISALLLVTLIVVQTDRPGYTPYLRRLFAGSIVVTVLSELSFTLYFGNYDFMNFVGHFLKIVSFYLIYKAIIEHSLRSPFESIFRDLRDSLATQARFFSILAHDLKNPFGGIENITTIMLAEIDTMPRETLREYLTHIRESAGSSVHLLSNLLLWSRSQTGRIRYSPTYFELDAVVHSVHDLFASSLRNKNIAFHADVDGSTRVWADRDMIETVLRNLVSNAVKFTERGGNVRVSSAASAGSIAISVADTGRGIDPDAVSLLFRADRPVRSVGTEGESGTGLGLLVCKEFVEKNGGELSVTSTPGIGTTFTFDLPRSE